MNTKQLPPLSPEKLREFQEFIWRAMGRLDGGSTHDLLDPASALGRAARAYYEELSEGRHWDEMVDYLAPMGSDLLAEPHPTSPPGSDQDGTIKPSDLGLGG
ncbi:MAG: hypothetical protein ACP5RV_08440 [Thiomonas sp.]